MKQFSLFVFLFIFLGVTPVFSFSGKLVKVLDGDTVEVLHNGRAERIRLNGIDTPEKGQPFGNKAKQFVLNVAAGETVKVHAGALPIFDSIRAAISHRPKKELDILPRFP